MKKGIRRIINSTILINSSRSSCSFVGILKILLLSIALTGCASSRDMSTLERYNRTMFGVNSAIDRTVVKPAAVFYRDNVPSQLRDRVTDFIGTWREPVDAVNLLAQGRLSDTLWSTWRFAINATLGFGGIVDISSEMGIKNPDSGFGTTLAFYGVPAGPFIVLPLLGPSNPRDVVGLVADSLVLNEWEDAIDISGGESAAMTAGTVIDGRIRFIGPDRLIEQAVDPFLAFKNGAQALRKRQVDLARSAGIFGSGTVNTDAGGVDEALDDILDE